MGNLFAALKKIYTKLPVSADKKTKMKNAVYERFGTVFRNNSGYQEWLSYRRWLQTEDEGVMHGSLKIDNKDLAGFHFYGKIAIQLHLFYVDLLDEFVEYFSNMPYEFDLLISVIDESRSDAIRKKAALIPKVHKIVIKKVENRGRDVAPLVSVFGHDLMQYDYFCHVHSKKSLFTGNEQMDWRRHLMSHLFGSETLIKEIFYGFEHGENVGMVYPETFIAMPYWGHTWLQNEKARDELFRKIRVPYAAARKYIEFPMGTMFWARTDALKQFFEAGIQVEDFPEEAGQTDGTIAHAFERCTVPVCRFNGYNILIYDDRTGSFRYNVGRKNFQQYCAKSFEKLKMEAADCDIVSFDVFDTLAARIVAQPDDAFDLLEARLNKGEFPGLAYKKLRKEAEEVCRREKPDEDCDLDDIYQKFGRISGLSAEQCEKIKAAEAENELELIYPKKEMVELYHYVTDILKKRVFLISDMYLRREDLVRILDKCNVVNYEKLFLSSELNLRKDDGSFWKEYSTKYDVTRWMHIGDNEKSDMQISGDYKIRGCHILSSADLYECSGMGDVYALRGIDNPVTSMAAGLTMKCLFENPFVLNEDRMQLVIRNERDFGYAVIAPVVLGYMNHLYRNIVKNGIKKVFFFAREGYLLKDLFDIMKGCMEEPADVEGVYMYVSRRALSVAAITTQEDIEQLLRIYYNGSFRNLLHSRFGIEDEEASDKQIQLPEDFEQVRKQAAPYYDAILREAGKERIGYLRYYESVRGNTDGRIYVSDIGYSGSIQYYLSKLTKDTFDGFYFATDAGKKPLAIEGNTLEGYYADGDDNQKWSDSYMHRYHLLLESILIAPTGQFVCVEDDGSFVYTEDVNPYFTKEIEECQQGIKEYFVDFYGKCGDIAPDYELDKAFAEGLVKAAVENNIMDKGLEKSFVVEDFYCSNDEISVLQFYKDKRYNHDKNEIA